MSQAGALNNTGGGGGGTGALQQVRVQDSSFNQTSNPMPLNNTIPTTAQGAQLFSATITPQLATSILLIECTINIVGSAFNGVKYILQGTQIALFRDAGVNAISTNISDGLVSQLSMTFFVSSVSKNPTTFALRYGTLLTSLGTPVCFVNGGISALGGGIEFSSMLITEYATWHFH